MPDFPPFLILRHGETAWNASGRLQGHHNSDLTARGIAQACAQHALLAGCDLTGYRAISSPQGRALRTAEIALQGLGPKIETDPALAEIGLGSWAGEDRAALMARTGAPDGFALYELAPGGEGFDALHARCTAFLATLESPAVLVTHGITSRMLQLVLTGRPAREVRDIGGGQGMVWRVAEGHQQPLSPEA